MPLWPARLHFGSPSASKPASSTRSPNSGYPSHDHVQAVDLHHEPPSYGVSLPPQSSTSPPRAEGRSQHGRSHSHPFPFKTGFNRQAEKWVEMESDDDIGEDIDGPVTHILQTSMKDRQIFPPGDSSPGDGPNNLVTGRCSTCASHVRWPRGLEVFRCTVCLMINDLKPAFSVSLWGPLSEEDSTLASTLPQVGFQSQVPYVSLEKTVTLIDECVNQYISIRNGQSSVHISIQKPEPNQIPKTALLSLPEVLLEPSSVDQHGLPPINVPPSPSRAPPPPPPHVLSDASTKDGERGCAIASQSIFRTLEDYIVACLTGTDCLNASFSVSKGPFMVRAASEGAAVGSVTLKSQGSVDAHANVPKLDAKTLLVGDIAENGSWWIGKGPIERNASQRTDQRVRAETISDKVDGRSPRIDWMKLNEWYLAILAMNDSCRAKIIDFGTPNSNVTSQDSSPKGFPPETLHSIEQELESACVHVQRTLLKATENLLRRPGRPLKCPEDCRFLLILLANPLLYSSEHSQTTRDKEYTLDQRTGLKYATTSSDCPPSSRRMKDKKGSNTGRHSGITKRILGLISNLSAECHHYLVSWFSRLTEKQFRRIVDLINSFITYRLSRQHGKKHSSKDPTGGLIPSVSGPDAGITAQLHAALGASATIKFSEMSDGGILYGDDWQIKAAAKTMSLLFSSNNNDPVGKVEPSKNSLLRSSRMRAIPLGRKRTHSTGQLLPTSAFYNTMLDYSDIVADFEIWESRQGKFTFCQYPMFLSIWAKIRIMEHDARRQMEIKAREAFFNSIMSRKAVNQYLVLKVRRECLVEDSLRGVSEVVGSGHEEIKKGLRIEFLGEEGLDSGGLRKEWFLLLVREVFDPEHGLFVYDEDSRCCYFNPNTFETSDQFFLVGVLLGLAIYNSTILDVALPPFAFRKLLASAPSYPGPTTSSSRPTPAYTLEDLGELHPSLAHGLRQLLEYDGDVEETFSRDFVVVAERYGQREIIPLCPSGERRPVTNTSRREFVDLYTHYLLETSVSRQYEPFKRGFFTVCGGNALSLFRPEEIELLVRGSDEPLDVKTLKTVALYEGWGNGVDASHIPVIIWFWEAFAEANAQDQRKLLSFITASDRIPAIGATSLVIKIVSAGEDSKRFPIARTCFNILALYRYPTKEVLEQKLWRAVAEGEGFGIK